jgi:hypothetical protein
METLAIIGLTTILGYSFANKDEGVRNVTINDTISDQMRVEEKPSSTNIYNSNMVNEAEDTVLQLSINNYEKSKDPVLTGVLPPIYNSYSAIGDESLLTNPIIDGSIKTLSNVNNVNRYTNPNDKGNAPEVGVRPMFKPLLNLDTSESTDFSNFGTGVSSDQTISLLTGQPIDRAHKNMVPFFGSNVKQNIESYTNVSTLDHYTGNKSTFIHKSEQGPRFDTIKQDIYGTPQVTTSIEMDRFIPSVYRQNEKPFQQERVSAPIAGTLNNPVTVAQLNQPTIDQLRVANKAQVTYAGRTVSGQMGNTRGVIGTVAKNKVDTHFELGHDRLFTSTGAVIAKQAPQNYAQMQATTRQSQNLEYYGVAVNKEKMKSTPRYTQSFDNSDELTSLSTATTRQQLPSDTRRNGVQVITPNKGDYGKGSYNLPELERDTTKDTPIINQNQSRTGHQVGVQDKIKNTMKQTTLIRDNSGNVKPLVMRPDMLTGVNLKTTQKETTVENKYKGAPNKKDQMGYVVANYEAKVTHKETVSESKFNGHASNQNAKNTMVYETYFNPEKVRNAPVAVDYKGGANAAVSQSENRTQFENAEVSENASQLVANQRPGGPQAFNIAGGTGVVGDLYVKPTMLLRAEENKRVQNIDNISSNIPTKNKLGELTNIERNVYGEIENKRETLEYAELIDNQLKDNPFYNLHRKL